MREVASIAGLAIAAWLSGDWLEQAGRTWLAELRSQKWAFADNLHAFPGELRQTAESLRSGWCRAQHNAEAAWCRLDVFPEKSVRAADIPAK